MFLMKYIRFSKLLFFPLIFLLISCGSARITKNSIKIKFLYEYIIPADYEFEGHLVGGLSDLDYDGTYFYTVTDNPRNPVIFKFSIPIENYKIQDIVFDEAIKIHSDTLVFDSEGILYHPDSNVFIVSSEGSINNNKNPFITSLTGEGTVINHFELPEYFSVSNEKGLRHNAVFEGLSWNIDKEGIWAATELPMISDGAKPKLYKTYSPVRFTYFDTTGKKPIKQFAYKLDRLRKVPLLPFSINGVSGILKIAPHQFIVIERAFSAGYGSKGNRVRLYLSDAREATNTLYMKNLRSNKKAIIPAKKQLLFDFKSVKKHLSHGFIDNIEGIVLGPRLPNGNQSLILISDNNFNSFSNQINQVILMEIIEN